MRPWLGALCAITLVLTVTAPGVAQQAPPSQPGTAGQGQQTPQPGGMQGGGMMMCPMMGMMGGGGMQGGGMMGGGMMGGGMQGMMGGAGVMGMMGGQTDPKTMGRMLQMRGEMLKAIGDVLMKHGKALESQPAK